MQILGPATVRRGQEGEGRKVRRGRGGGGCQRLEEEWNKEDTGNQRRSVTRRSKSGEGEEEGMELKRVKEEEVGGKRRRGRRWSR